jgi:hypothetical protein
VKRRVGDPPVLVASSRRARRELGWQPQHSKLEQMLGDAWAWRKGHPSGYAPSSPEQGPEPSDATPRHISPAPAGALLQP